MKYILNYSPKFWYVATNGVITEIGRVSPQKAELLGEEITVFRPVPHEGRGQEIRQGERAEVQECREMI